MTSFIRAVFCLALAAISVSSASAQQLTLEGNSLSDRIYNSDVDATNTLFVLDFSIANAGTMHSIQTWGELSGGGIPGVGEIFYAYVLRPTSTNQGTTNLQVMAETGPLRVANTNLNVFPTQPFALEVGDVVAHYGRGIPLTTDTGGPSSVYVNGGGIPLPNIGDTLTFPSAAFPLYNDGGRDYAVAVGLVALSELNIALAGTNVVVSWPATNTYPLMQTSNLNGGSWKTITNYTTVNTTNILTVPAAGQSSFWSLRPQN